jgi:hypothetical protein
MIPRALHVDMTGLKCMFIKNVRETLSYKVGFMR